MLNKNFYGSTILIRTVMKLHSKLFCNFGFLCALFFILSVHYIIHHGSFNEEVEGWGYNVTRNISHYLVRNSQLHIMPEHFCQQKELLLIMVQSSPKNFEARSAIRETWGRKMENVSVFFFIGETDSAIVQHKLFDETEEFEDIIQQNFYDSYNNLTLKSVFMLNLFNKYCAKVDYLLKADDDVFINLHLITGRLLNASYSESKKLLLGHLITNSTPIRTLGHKWYSPHYLYPDDTYPDYLSGPAYLMSAPVARRIYRATLDIPFFHMEDVYITGLCAKEAGITAQNDARFRPSRPTWCSCSMQELFTVHSFNPKELRKIYKCVKECREDM